LFLLGLLSLMDSILEIPMSEVLDSVPIERSCSGGAAACVLCTN
jgi:c-di-GMP-related signal transduction protein